MLRDTKEEQMEKLTGSEKQIAWAEKIRSENVAGLQSFAEAVQGQIDGFVAACKSDGAEVDADLVAHHQAKVDKANEIIDRLIKGTSAKNFIENRTFRTNVEGWVECELDGSVI
jgi:hypothetical protein